MAFTGCYGLPMGGTDGDGYFSPSSTEVNTLKRSKKTDREWLLLHSLYINISRCSELVYIELSYYFVPTAVLKKERSGLRD